MRVQHQKKNENNTKMKNTKEYDFSKGVRGKYSKRFKSGTNVVVLEPDVAKVFRNSAAVNEMLRMLAKIALRAK